MKKLLSAILFAIIALAGQAQEIKMNETTFSDYKALLNAKGYMLYSFNISELKGSKIELYMKEYVDSQEVKSVSILGSAYSMEPKGDKVLLGVLPSDNDSTLTYYYNLENTLIYTGKLKMKPIFWASENKWITQYHTRPFDMAPVEKEKFIPLVLYGSIWYDEKWKITRFCGENTIKPDLSSDILKYLPHYYILGIIVH